MLTFPMPENRTKTWLKNICLDFIAKEMWHLNSLELNTLEYHACGQLFEVYHRPHQKQCWSPRVQNLVPEDPRGQF